MGLDLYAGFGLIVAGGIAGTLLIELPPTGGEFDPVLALAAAVPVLLGVVGSTLIDRAVYEDNSTTPGEEQ